MNHSTHQDAAEAAATFVTRREALLNALKSTVAASVAAPVIMQAAPEFPGESGSHLCGGE